MKKYALFSLLPSRIEIIQTEGLASEEVEIVENYALPFGSNWSKVIGARSARVFSVGRNRVCLAYTVVGKTSDERPNPVLHCIASIHETDYLDSVLSSRYDWLNAMVSPLLDYIDDPYLGQLLKESLMLKPQQSTRVKFIHWLSVQLHIKLLLVFRYKNPQEWTLQEEYVRRLYLARRWQLGFFGFRPPSFTTFTMSKGEFTDISVFALPVI